ncbi:hypothetical protein LPTSP4_21740 [Leptospira ryugenii]|uniref:Uncharacterized protein n=1 Tax=Leptospira ryugenii TaxID=1917863 RepID=A0A2P2E185_9LEPT|nr:hypothetical protein [Leptospira ryugenii]GBF50648.1 hypothetical protein LPTSP4_21740 [Leptospira ryugenii]
MKRLFLFFAFMASSVFAGDGEDLENVRKKIEKQNNGFMTGTLITSIEDNWFYGVHYYKNDGSFKKLLTLKEREEIIEKFGDRRRWFVSKWQGKQPAIYVSADYVPAFYNQSSQKNNKLTTDLKDHFDFYFKNYCEFDGVVDTRYARIKKMRLTYFDAPYTAINNMMNIKVVGNFKKIISYDIDIKEDDNVIDAMQTYYPIKPTTLFGNIFAIQLKVLEVYPGEKEMPLCTSDYYMGRKGLGTYDEILKQIDELPELKGKRNPY